MLCLWSRLALGAIALLAGGSCVAASLAETQLQQVFGATTTAGAETTWKAKFTPDSINTTMDTTVQALLEITNIDTSEINYHFQLHSQKPRLASVNLIITPQDVDPLTRSWRGNVSIDALFLGATNIYVELVNTLSNTTQPSKNILQLIIVRQTRVIDTLFVISVATLVSLLYINFGAALDLNVLRGLLTYPVGPVIGFVSQFVVMPVLSYAIGYFLFPDSVEMQLGLFFTGVSPSGGASNIWAVLLGGNIHLSVLMTTISNIAAFGMMPLWLFTLGSLIFERGNMVVPYRNIASFAVSLVVPLAIGVAIQKYSPRVTCVLVRLLKPISTMLILFIIIFAIITNLYIFELFSWQIVVAGSALPWLGYFIAWLAAKTLHQNAADALTIAIETGIQNTGIAIFLLRFSLPQPQADLTTVVPVAVAIMTPLPLFGIYLYKRYSGSSIKMGMVEEENFVAPQPQQQHHIS